MSIIEDIKHQFRTGNVLMQLIYVNIGVFLLYVLLAIVQSLFQNTLADSIFRWIKLPSNLMDLLFSPWTLLTHMFTHTGLTHILFNMITLFFAGQIFLGFLNGRQLLSTYIMGGLSGALVFIISMNVFPAFSHIDGIALGASAAILAILIAVATLVPDNIVNLSLIGPVKLKFIAIVFILMDLIFLPSGNAGGHLGHLGGALYGFYFGLQARQGKDISVNFMGWFNAFKKAIKPSSKIKVVHRNTRSDENYNERRANRQKQVDLILDKISKSGYESLSKAEKELLFKASNDL